MDTSGLTELWTLGTTTCLITPVTGPAPYWVFIRDTEHAVSQCRFDKYSDAVTFALTELTRFTNAADSTR